MRLLTSPRSLARPLLVALFVIPAAAAHANGLPELPTDLGGSQQLEVRPRVVAFTGDGTGVFGGFDGRPLARRPSRSGYGWAGHIDWSKWGVQQANGTGAVWLDDGTPNDALGTFHAYAVTLRAFRPREGVFTALSYRYTFEGRTEAGTLRAHRVVSELGPSYWAWPGG
jgi:hypothetical protein